MTELGEKLLKLTELRFRYMSELPKLLLPENNHLSAILQCHLFVEGVLEELIRLSLGQNAEAVLGARLSFDQKLAIASKLQLAEGWPVLEDYVVGSLRKLNALRNKLAHRYGHDVSGEDVKELFVGCERDLLYEDVLSAGVEIAIGRYVAFIFGNLLPKYERVDEA